jgi:hypothetical protein
METYSTEVEIKGDNELNINKDEEVTTADFGLKMEQWVGPHQTTTKTRHCTTQNARAT